MEARRKLKVKMDEMERFSREELEELYRTYEFSNEISFPEMYFPCGTLQNYVDTGILTREEAAGLWTRDDMKK